MPTWNEVLGLGFSVLLWLCHVTTKGDPMAPYGEKELLDYCYEVPKVTEVTKSNKRHKPLRAN